MKHSSFDVTISALDAETSSLVAATSAIAWKSFDATILALDAETSAITQSYLRYRHRVFSDIGDCGVGVTPQMCNRVTNHGDMGTFSRPDVDVDGSAFFECELLAEAVSSESSVSDSVSWNSLVCHFVVYLQ